MIKRALLAAALCAGLGTPALAQTALTPPSVNWGNNINVVPPPSMQVGYDSGTSLPCVVGSTSTCQLAVSVKSTTPAAAVPSTDASGTVTTGGTYQTILASNTSRKGCTVQNPPTATEVLNIRVGSTTVFYVPVGGTFKCNSSGLVVSDTIYGTAATSGHAFSADYQ